MRQNGRHAGRRLGKNGVRGSGQCVPGDKGGRGARASVECGVWRVIDAFSSLGRDMCVGMCLAFL